MKTLNRVMKKVVIGTLVLYKFIVSPCLTRLFGGGCRYQPTCSNYSREAIEKFGIFHGLRLSLLRLFRCNPFSKSFGYDPVPVRHN